MAQKRKTAKKKTGKRPARKAAKKTAGKKTAARKKTASRKKVARKPAAKKKAGKKNVVRKTTAKKKTKRKPARKKATRPSAEAIGAQIDKRIDELVQQLAEVRELTEKEFARQRRNIDEFVDTMKKDQDKLKARLGEFIDEHNSLKEISAGVVTTAKEIEEGIRKVAARLRSSEDKDKGD